jgi:hypothetical protein
MRGAEVAVAVLNQVQMLDQQITLAGPVGEQRAYLAERLLLDLAPLRMAPVPPSARSRAAVLADLACGVGHPLDPGSRSLPLSIKDFAGPPVPVRQQ